MLRHTEVKNQTKPNKTKHPKLVQGHRLRSGNMIATSLAPFPNSYPPTPPTPKLYALTTL